MKPKWAVKKVVPLNDYKLLLTFARGTQKVFDMKPYLKSPVFAHFNEQTFLELRQ